jgi:cobalt-precorrin 5A hydrolase
MKLAVIALNHNSLRLGNHLCRCLVEDRVFLHLPQKLRNAEAGVAAGWFTDLSSLVPSLFEQYEGLIFIAPLGLAYRLLAPCIKNKHRDPAVVVVDEGGRFCISALSGHEGGANALAARLAAHLGGEAVITTSAEARRRVIAGLGCRRGATSGAIKQAVMLALDRADQKLEAVRQLCTVDIKRDEPGIWTAARELELPLQFIPRSWLKRVAVQQPSNWVKQQIGVEGVAEGCALLGGKRTRIILPKTIVNGVTIALAEEGSIW